MKPRIIICRHAESIEDVDNTIYSILDDLEIPLTENGRSQAANLGNILAQVLKNSTRVQFYTSPGVRNVQTLKEVIPRLPDSIAVNVEVEPLIVKQCWGKIDLTTRSSIEAERYRVGVLRYTFPQGESALSLISRLEMFKNKILSLHEEKRCDVVVLSHGFEFRVLLKLILGWSEELFESYGNLNNCEYRILTQVETGKYALDRDLRMHGNPITRLKN
ncbi:MAG: phosphoglycerate mutase-like protein [Candidatus Parcubacteria bacterium]|nr:phosphoglycerate mutase-like protein [Candidatus Parcubacteria bacterium]